MLREVLAGSGRADAPRPQGALVLDLLRRRQPATELEDRFAQLQMDKRFMPLTLREAQRLEPLAFEAAGVRIPD